VYTDNEGYHVYKNNDGRIRCYDPKTKKVTSYPRILMERELGYPLKSYEQVHHNDENPLNNNIYNLSIMDFKEHQKYHGQKYHDTLMICPWCQKEFNWTAKKQQNFYSNLSRKVYKAKNPILKPFCSRKCAGSYSRQEQLRRNSQAECQLNGEAFLMVIPCQ